VKDSAEERKGNRNKQKILIQKQISQVKGKVSRNY